MEIATEEPPLLTEVVPSSSTPEHQHSVVAPDTKVDNPSVQHSVDTSSLALSTDQTVKPRGVESPSIQEKVPQDKGKEVRVTTPRQQLFSLIKQHGIFGNRSS